MKYYLAIKKNEILSFAGKWMEMEKPGSERRSSHVEDTSKYKYKYYHIYIHTCMHVSKSGTVRRDKGWRKRRKE
jgi:hypothetical protein